VLFGGVIIGHMAVGHIGGEEGRRQNFPIRHKDQLGTTFASQILGARIGLQDISGIGPFEIGRITRPLFQKA